MVKKFTANCDFGGTKSPVTLYVGDPAIGSHPLEFQNRWLSKDRGGIIPPEIMSSFEKLRKISEEYRTPFEDLCAYVIEELKNQNHLAEDAESGSELTEKKDKK